jgi:excisionase family DNA binding protein
VRWPTRHRGPAWTTPPSSGQRFSVMSMLIRQEWFSVPQSTRYTGMSVDTLRRRVVEGVLPASRSGGSRGRVYIRRSDLDALMVPITATGDVEAAS